MPSKDSKEEKKEKAREVVDILEEISLLLVSYHVWVSGSSGGLITPTSRTLIWIGLNCHYVCHS